MAKKKVKRDGAASTLLTVNAAQLTYPGCLSLEGAEVPVAR